MVSCLALNEFLETFRWWAIGWANGLFSTTDIPQMMCKSIVVHKFSSVESAKRGTNCIREVLARAVRSGELSFPSKPVRNVLLVANQ